MSSALTTLSRPFSHLPSPVHPGAHRQPGRYALAPLSLKKVQETILADEAALYTGGLRTPPAEDSMSTAYQNHNAVLASTYDGHVALARQPSSLAQASRAGGAIYAAAVNQMSRNQSQQQQQFHSQPTYQPQQSHYAPPVSSVSRHSTRPSTPASTKTARDQSESALSRRDSAMVMHSLQLPTCISPSGGSLDEFAALMTCFFWFESMETIQAAEQIKERRSGSPIPPLSNYTRPVAAYKKWVNSILSTTQVNQNVILLALLFIYRLKSTNPKVHGGPGSEYRLLTVALMLGNKFLDDNTYTNKTWAEVSGFAVKEIHVMEVEFLSNMRYDLLTSKEQWDEWLEKLACFHEYCRQAELGVRAAEMTAIRQRTAPVAMGVASPAVPDYNSPLPSPTRVLSSSMQGSASSLTSYSPNSSMSSSSQTWPGNYQPTAASSPLIPRPDMCLPVPRKRSLEGSEIVEPAPKRVTRQTPMSALAPIPRHPPSAAEAVRLPVPHLTLNVPQASYTPTPGYSQSPVSLPPLDTGVRAMSTVYPNPATWASQVPLQATCGPQTPSYPVSAGYGTPTKRHSPGGLAVYGSSPLIETFSTHTPLSLSPSVYLQQRNSPYKPLRPVNTLNYPAPSIPLSEYHLGSAQMHYQPLGRRNVRTGIVPEFLPGHSSGRPLPAL